MSNVIDQEEMQKVWEQEQEILDVIHAVCRKNHLRYTLFYGTLLGAVRHGSFIPWDDDIDLLMPRRDYEKLLKIWKQEAPAGYVIQTPYSSVDYVNNFAKVRKDHTTFIQSEEERNKSYHKGFFVDIFPADRVANGAINSRLQFAFAALNLLYSRGYGSGAGGVMGLGEKVLLLVPRKFHRSLRRMTEKLIESWNNDTKAGYASFNTIRDCRKVYPATLFSTLKRIEFNGKRYYSIVDTDTALTVKYGDYMQLPPEEKRVWMHHPILVDYEHNYEELENKE